MSGIREALSSLLIFVVMLLMGCSSHKVTDGMGYIRYVSDRKNGMIQDKSMSALKYEAIYLTPEAMTLTELKDSVTKEKYTKLLPEYSGMQYIRFVIKGQKKEHVYNAVTDEGKDPDNIEAYLNLDAQNDFMIISGHDTSRCGLYSFARTYGLGHDWQLLLGFEKKDTINDVQLLYDDKIGDNGVLSFRFKRADIKKLPMINFSL